MNAAGVIGYSMTSGGLSSIYDLTNGRTVVTFTYNERAVSADAGNAGLRSVRHNPKTRRKNLSLRAKRSNLAPTVRG